MNISEGKSSLRCNKSSVVVQPLHCVQGRTREKGVNIGTHYKSFGPFWGWSGVAFAAVVASRRSVDEVLADSSGLWILCFFVDIAKQDAKMRPSFFSSIGNVTIEDTRTRTPSQIIHQRLYINFSGSVLGSLHADSSEHCMMLAFKLGSTAKDAR